MRPRVEQAGPPAVEVQGSSSPVFTVQWLGVSIVSPGVLGTEGQCDRTSNCTDNQRFMFAPESEGSQQDKKELAYL